MDSVHAIVAAITAEHNRFLASELYGPYLMDILSEQDKIREPGTPADMQAAHFVLQQRFASGEYSLPKDPPVKLFKAYSVFQDLAKKGPTIVDWVRISRNKTPIPLYRFFSDYDSSTFDLDFCENQINELFTTEELQKVQEFIVKSQGVDCYSLEVPYPRSASTMPHSVRTLFELLQHERQRAGETFQGSSGGVEMVYNPTTESSFQLDFPIRGILLGHDGSSLEIDHTYFKNNFGKF